MSDVSARAAAAERLINDPVLQEAFKNVRDAAVETWIGTGVAQTEQREFAWLTVKVIGRIEAELQTIINDGKLAAKRVQNPVR